MEHKNLDEIRSISRTAPAAALEQAMGRREKLERWAMLLEGHKGHLKPLRGIEYLAPERQMKLRGDESPLAVAYRDPVLRAHGLLSDQLGDGGRFFELTNAQAHRLLCDCHYGARMTASELAARLRFTARHPLLSRFL